jgi:hypothetical protein
MGHAGFETQTHVWLNGQLDPERLQLALTRLAEGHPVVASALVEAAGGNPHWQHRSTMSCSLTVTKLHSDSPQAVLDHAARLLGTAHDLRTAGPIRFHLLRRPDGRDVFLMQYNHALMDHAAAVPVLREIHRLSREPAAPRAGEPGGDPIWAHLRRWPRARRRKAAARTLETWRAWLRRGGTVLGRPSPADAGAGRVALAVRRLEIDASTAVEERVRKVCGVPSLSMALLGSAFRQVARLAPAPPTRPLVAGIGVDLGLRRNAQLFQNQPSVVPIGAQLEGLTDRDGLVRLLNRQMRDCLTSEMDLGALELAAAFGRRPHQAEWALELFFRYGYSLWYAYFGALDAVGETFCGTPVDEVFSAGPTWSPMGLTLLINRFRGRLLLQATYLPSWVPGPLANDFLDGLIKDLM